MFDWQTPQFITSCIYNNSRDAIYGFHIAYRRLPATSTASSSSHIHRGHNLYSIFISYNPKVFLFYIFL